MQILLKYIFSFIKEFYPILFIDVQDNKHSYVGFKFILNLKNNCAKQTCQ